MKYCQVEKDGTIGKPQKLPAKHANVAGGFHKLSNEKLKAYGFYPYQELDFDSRLQEITGYQLDDDVVKPIIENKGLDLQEEKEKKIIALQRYVYELLQKTDHYYIRLQERGKAVPDGIKQERQDIHNACDQMKEDINSLSDVKSVCEFDYTLSKPKYH